MCEIYSLYAIDLSHVVFTYSENYNIKLSNEILSVVLHIWDSLVGIRKAHFLLQDGQYCV